MSFSKKQTYVIVLLSLLCLAVLGTYLGIVISSMNSDENEEEQNAQILVDYFTPSKISKISFDIPEKPLSFRRHNGVWLYEQNEKLPVSNDRMTSLLLNLQYVTALRLIDEKATELSEYGLSPAKYTVSFTVQGEEHTYYFGNKSDYYDGYYFIKKDSTKLYILPESYINCFDIELEELLELDEYPKVTESSALSFTSASGVKIENTDKLFEILSELEIDKFIDYGSEVYGTYNLLSPAQGKIDGIKLSFSLGESDDIVYMLIGESEMIYTVKSEKLTALRELIMTENA